MAKVETEIIMPEIAIGDDFGQAMELAERAAISRDAQWAREEDIKVEQNRILAREGMRHVYVLNPEGNYVVKRFRSIGEAAIQRVWQYRKDTKVPLCFTLDAGANVHLLYPKSVKDEVQTFIKNELVHFCEEGKYINDQLAN